MCSSLPGVRTSTSSMGHRDRETRDSPSPKRPRRPRDQSSKATRVALGRRLLFPFPLSIIISSLPNSPLQPITNLEQQQLVDQQAYHGQGPRRRPDQRRPPQRRGHLHRRDDDTCARRQRPRLGRRRHRGRPAVEGTEMMIVFLATLKRECYERRTLGERSSLRGQTGDRRGEHLTFFPPLGPLTKKKKLNFLPQKAQAARPE